MTLVRDDYRITDMNALSVSEVAANAGVTSQAVSIALTAKRLTAVEVIGRRAVKRDAKYDKFLKSTRNRANKKANGKDSD